MFLKTSGDHELDYKWEKILLEKVACNNLLLSPNYLPIDNLQYSGCTFKHRYNFTHRSKMNFLKVVFIPLIKPQNLGSILEHKLPQKLNQKVPQIQIVLLL